MASITFTVNGALREVEADAGTQLLYVLRNQLGLNGPRYGCGQEQCGACRVMIDGELAWSCTTPVGTLQGAEIITVDGLASGNDLHPLQQAFLENNAAQCGYCASGILMSAYALLRDNTRPDRMEIQEALAQNLCRCGAHNRIIRAIERAAEIMRSA